MLTSFLLPQAKASDCYDGVYDCGRSWGRSSSSSSSTGGKVKINPSAVPVEKGLGIEGIFFNSDVDFGIVRGNGRIGAAISPANSEETFFGPPGFALPEDTLVQKMEKKKFPNQKATFAMAFNVTEKNVAFFNRFSLKAGLMAKYNRLTYTLSPGFGVSGTLGPISFGGSVYNDVTQLNYETYGNSLRPIIPYQVHTYNLGLFLSSLVLDYSTLRVQTPDVSIVHLYTASFFIKSLILTASKRVEESSRPNYNFATKMLEAKRIKEESFGGVQYTLSKDLMMGVLYNYYLLHEYSLTATLFF
ncbi:MAG: hypothetical protein ACXWRE_10835 [Pseudobdellovibrionaceae bacterium]